MPRWQLSYRCLVRLIAINFVILCLLPGCRHHQFARVIQPGDREMIGSHQAGQETFKPLVDEAVSKLLARHQEGAFVQVSMEGDPNALGKMRICFVGVENRTAEEIGDFKEQIYEHIDTMLMECGACAPINRRYVDAGLRQLRLKPDELFIPANMWRFTSLMEQNGQPIDYLLFAKLTSGTTRENKDYQRDYLLTLEMVNIQTGEQDKQSATLSKGYHHSWASRAWSKMSSIGTK